MQGDNMFRILYAISKRIVFLLIFILFWAPFIPVNAQESPGFSVEFDYRDDITYNHPNYVEQLPDGNILACRVGFREPAIVQISPNGTETVLVKGIQASCAKLLSSGNILIADSGVPGKPFTPRVLEVTTNGSAVWEYSLQSLSNSPRYVERLQNGNILITLPHKIIEVNRDKKIVWSYGWGKPVKPDTRGYLANPVQAMRLESGNTLIVDRGTTNGTIFEITPKKDVVWQFGSFTGKCPFTADNTGKQDSANAAAETTACLFSPTGALRLPDGNTLIADKANLLLAEIDPAGAILKKMSWKEGISGQSVMNQWMINPQSNYSLIIPCTLTSSRSLIRIIKFDDIQNP